MCRMEYKIYTCGDLELNRLKCCDGMALAVLRSALIRERQPQRMPWMSFMLALPGEGPEGGHHVRVSFCHGHRRCFDCENPELARERHMDPDDREREREQERAAARRREENEARHREYVPPSEEDDDDRRLFDES